MAGTRVCYLAAVTAVCRVGRASIAFDAADSQHEKVGSHRTCHVLQGVGSPVSHASRQVVVFFSLYSQPLATAPSLSSAGPDYDPCTVDEAASAAQHILSPYHRDSLLVCLGHLAALSLAHA